MKSSGAHFMRRRKKRVFGTSLASAILADFG